MHILLINNNPVVSRLLSLCARNESIVLEEIREIEECKRDSYDIAFVDETVHKGKIQVLNEHLTIRKKVLLTHSDISVSDFDVQIKKPFLPSEILEIFESLTEIESESLKENTATQVLDGNEIEKIKDLLQFNDNELDANNEVLSDEEYEARKMKVIKEQLISEGLEIVEEKEILDDLGVNNDSNEWKFSKEENMFLNKVKSKKMESKTTKKKKQKLAHKNDDLIVQAVEMAMRTLKKKQRKQLLKGKKVEITIQLEGKH